MDGGRYQEKISGTKTAGFEIDLASDDLEDGELGEVVGRSRFCEFPAIHGKVVARRERFSRGMA